MKNTQIALIVYSIIDKKVLKNVNIGLKVSKKKIKIIRKMI